MTPRAAASDARPDEPGALIFAWERPRRRVLRLAALLIVSFFLHAITFYVLQVAYIPIIPPAPPPAEVMMLPPDSEENKALARWLAFADPALLAQSTGPTTEEALAALTFHYVPSYAAALPAFKSLDPPAKDEIPARASIFGPMPLPPLPDAVLADARRTPINSPSRLVFTGGVGELALRPLPAIQFSARKAIGKDGAAKELPPLEPTVYLIGIPAGGGTPFLFRLAALGNAAADESARAADDYARDYLARLKFLPTPDSAAPPWGTATFYWGAEAYR